MGANEPMSTVSVTLYYSSLKQFAVKLDLLLLNDRALEEELEKVFFSL